MTAKKKAIRLFTIMYGEFENGISHKEAKRCALIAVDEIMKQCFDYRDIDLQASYDYWQEVKQEIEKL